MLYRDRKEYNLPRENQNHELLRSWLRGETGVESLREWLQTMYN